MSVSLSNYTKKQRNKKKAVFEDKQKGTITLKPERPRPPKLVCMHFRSTATCTKFLSQFYFLAPMDYSPCFERGIWRKMKRRKMFKAMVIHTKGSWFIQEGTIKGLCPLVSFTLPLVSVMSLWLFFTLSSCCSIIHNGITNEERVKKGEGQRADRETLLLSKTVNFSFRTMDYSPWSSKNLIYWDRL